MSEKSIIPFEYFDGSKTYKCERVITGDKVQLQTIRVVGVGTKPDTASYGPGAHPPSSMETTAALIAAEIVAAHLNKST